MRGLRVTVAVAATLVGLVTACGSDSTDPTARPSVASSSPTTTTAPADAPVPVSDHTDGSTGSEGVGEDDPAPDDGGHQPWREACAEDPNAYPGCQEGDPAADDGGHQPWREACAEDPTAYAGCQP